MPTMITLGKSKSGAAPPLGLPAMSQPLHVHLLLDVSARQEPIHLLHPQPH